MRTGTASTPAVKEDAMNLKDYYHLKKDKFAINPDDDAEVYFGGADLEHRIKRRILRDFNQERGVPKFFVYGPYGGGKTHTLRHVEYRLGTDPELREGLPHTRPVRFELAPVRSKERWLSVHTRLMNAIGQELIREAASRILTDPAHAPDPLGFLKQAGVLRFGETAIQASQAVVFRNLILGFGGRQATLSWEWLRGRQLNLDETQTIGTQANLAEPGDLVHALLNVASLVRVALGEKLLFLIDEGEAAENLTSVDSIREFEYSLRRLVDDDNDVLGLVIAYQFEPGMGQAPEVFAYDAIRRRVGYEAGYIDLTGHLSAPENARKFILEVLEHLVDQDAARKTITNESLSTEPEYFPFEEEAVDLLANYVTTDPQLSLPSQIITRMSDAAVEAWLSREASPQRRLVDEEIINRVLYPS
jgi:hypothetical protein